MSSENPVVQVGVGVFVLKSSQKNPENPRFLIGKRLGAHGAGTYALPGGHLKFGETPEQCATRELMEETGLRASNAQFLTATNDYMEAEGKHYVTMFMVCSRDNELHQPEILEPDKCAGWEWVSWNNLIIWVKRQRGAGDDGALDRKLFLPLMNLVEQRPGVKPLISRKDHG